MKFRQSFLLSANGETVQVMQKLRLTKKATRIIYRTWKCVNTIVFRNTHIQILILLGNKILENGQFE